MKLPIEGYNPSATMCVNYVSLWKFFAKGSRYFKNFRKPSHDSGICVLCFGKFLCSNKLPISCSLPGFTHVLI